MSHGGDRFRNARQSGKRPPATVAVTTLAPLAVAIGPALLCACTDTGQNVTMHLSPHLIP